MGDQAHAYEVLIDVWRCANLMHAATYCIADHHATTYTFDGFLLPLSEAFGPHDGHTQLGMFRREELEALGKAHLVSAQTQAVSLTHGAPDPGAGVGAGGGGGSRTFYDQTAASAEDDLMGDVRGDVRSHAALCYQLYSCRLYRLVRESIRVRLTAATWPVWGSALSGLRDACEEVQRRALYRLPNAYRATLWLLVIMTLVIDGVIGGIIVGRAHRGADGAEAAEAGGARAAHPPPWAEEGEEAQALLGRHALGRSFSGSAAAVWTSVALAVLFVPSVLLLSVCIELEEPFGDNHRDLPGVAFVRSAAEATLNLVAPHPVCRDFVAAAMHVDLNHHRLSSHHAPPPSVGGAGGAGPDFSHGPSAA